MQNLINNKQFMADVYKLSGNDLENVQKILGNTFSFLIATKGKVKIDKPAFSLGDYFKLTGADSKKCEKQVLKNPLFTHSFNGCNLKAVKKHGLGSDETHNQKIKRKCF